jgi:hypothetical protein
MLPELYWPSWVAAQGIGAGSLTMVMENVRPVKRRASKPVSQPLKSVPPSDRPSQNAALKFEGPEIDELLYALQAMQAGDFSARMGSNHTGIYGKLADCFNGIAAANQRVAHELTLVGEVVGQQGRTRHRADMGRSDGAGDPGDFGGGPRRPVADGQP